jgi:hypothetical protein
LDSGLGDSVIGRLLRERLDELSVEANLLRTCGRSEFVTWARRRFEFSEAELSQAHHLSGQWLELPSSSSDQGQLLPLVSQLQRMAQKREAAWGVNVRVIERPLASVAAVGGDAVYVRPGARATPAEAERIFAHEVEGHLLPRLRGRAGPPPFRIGTRNCSVDEEGRAILLEERRGTLDARRKSELAVRFFVGDAAQQGRQALGDEVRRLLRLNVAPAILARTLVRAFRGGGLGREKIYVVAYLRVRDALRRTPELESWMERGRISLCGARALREDCASIQPQSNSITTGA